MPPRGSAGPITLQMGTRLTSSCAGGDPLFDGSGEFNAAALNAESQAQRFGYNNDYIAFLPSTDRGGGRCCA